MLDMIEISNEVDHPDIFFTVTCNPKWKEMTEELLLRQTAPDKPQYTCYSFSNLNWKLFYI